MPAPNFLAVDFAQALQRLLPPGRAWQRLRETVQFLVMMGLAPVYERNTARANNLLVDAFPSTTIELLPEWEETLGLPDPCAGQAPTLAARQAQVLARFASEGGQSRAFYIAYARQLGYEIEIRDYAPFRAGHSSVGQPLAGADWYFAWAIVSALYTVNYFRAGVGSAGEPLAYWSNAVLECELEKVKPAHTILIFIYE